MSYCRIHTSKITHLRGSVNAFPAVQPPPHFSSNNLSMQHQPTSIAFEWCITWVEVTTNPQAGIPRECPTAHITMESFVNTSSVIPWTTNEYDCKPNTITAFCNTSIWLHWMNGNVVLCSLHRHATTCTFLSATTSSTSSRTCYLGSHIPTICHCSIHLLKILTLHKLSNTLRVFPFLPYIIRECKCRWHSIICSL